MFSISIHSRGCIYKAAAPGQGILYFTSYDDAYKMLLHCSSQEIFPAIKIIPSQGEEVEYIPGSHIEGVSILKTPTLNN